MKAFVLKSLNIPPAVIDVPLPGLRKNEVLVKVAYCGVNRVDLGLLSGRFGNSISFPHIMGSEIVGTLRNGRKVAVNPYLQHAKGRPLLGVQTNGGYAQYVSVPKESLVNIPDDIPLDRAASVVLSAATAYRMIYTKAKICNKDTVIITAAGSGVGVYSCQLAKLNQSFVIGLIGNQEKINKLKKIKVDNIVDYSQSNWIGSLTKLLLEKEATVLIDTVGGKILENIIPLLSPSARIVFCGATENPNISLNLIDIYMKQKILIGSSGFTNRDLKAVFELLENYEITPVIDSIFNINQIPQAWNKLKSRNIFGKILIKIA